MGYSIIENSRCKRCFRRIGLLHLKGGLCWKCREELGLPVEKTRLPLFLEENQ